jgi:hypothetical protein
MLRLIYFLFCLPLRLKSIACSAGRTVLATPWVAVHKACRVGRDEPGQSGNREAHGDTSTRGKLHCLATWYRTRWVWRAKVIPLISCKIKIKDNFNLQSIQFLVFNLVFYIQRGEISIAASGKRLLLFFARSGLLHNLLNNFCERSCSHGGRICVDERLPFLARSQNIGVHGELSQVRNAESLSHALRVVAERRVCRFV